MIIKRFYVISLTVIVFLILSWSVLKYQSAFYEEWNAFIAEAKNATFLFHRDFMEYHNDRFDDCSLMVFKNNSLLAVLPAHVKGDVLYSHQGLTYGGIVVKEEMKTELFISLFKKLLYYLHENGIKEFVVKKIPSFYTRHFNDEIDYLAFALKAVCFRADTCSVLDLHNPVISKSRLRDAKKAANLGITVKETADFYHFWKHVLTPNLEMKYGVKPVHSYEEIVMLKARFSENIRFFQLILHNEIIGGTVLFLSEKVVHVQYISGLPAYKNTGALDFLFITLIEKFKHTYTFFDFGTSNENQGRQLNKGLISWKEAFGARTCIQPFYCFSTAAFSQIDTIFTV